MGFRSVRLDGFSATRALKGAADWLHSRASWISSYSLAFWILSIIPILSRLIEEGLCTKNDAEVWIGILPAIINFSILFFFPEIFAPLQNEVVCVINIGENQAFGLKQ